MASVRLRLSPRLPLSLTTATEATVVDMEATMVAIIKASSLPVSIIIVGVGDADFTEMNALDSDDRLLRHGNLVARRDIVQFVELRKFVSGAFSSKELLAKSILAEIPAQLSSWMKMKGFKPVQTNLTKSNQGNFPT